MTLQDSIIVLTLVACVAYVTFVLYKTIKKAVKCKQYECAGCPFYGKCKKNSKKVDEKFGGTK